MVKSANLPAVQSAADRLAAAQSEDVALEQEKAGIISQVTVALVSGDDASALKKRLNEIEQRRSDLKLLVAELERRMREEERRTKIARLQAARENRQARDEYLRQTLRPAYDAALAALNATQDRLDAFTKGSKPCEGFEPDYVFSAQSDLAKHREIYPDVQEGAE